MISLLLLTTLILRGGERISVEGAITESAGRVVFRAAGGTLYSLPASEVDTEATRAAAAAPPPTRDDGKKKLKVSSDERERLLRDLEGDHSGAPATPQQLQPPALPPVKDQTEDEWRWRREARAHEEAVRRAKENLTLLTDRVERLQSEIRGFLSLGYKPHQFSLQTSQLENTREAIPYAELEVTRAERALEEFHEDARKQGILPGWLR